ncbi:MAG TPA: thioredoxin domain-containing protein [Polyangia bacterium]|nr:thioredoxin domain-containing protein [Polyangia bacterium]
MTLGRLAGTGARVTVLVLMTGAAACAKSPPEAHSAPAATPATKPGDKPADKKDDGADTTLPPGMDVSKLDELAKKIFFRVVNSEPSVCGKGQSLLASAKTDSSCRRSLNAVKYVARLADQGYTQSEIADSLEKRYRSTDQKFIDVAEAPMEGNANARVTLVEFADYECPHCKRFQPVLRQILDEFRKDIRIYFKHYPLPQHTNARLAAEAAVAAQKQGKFWPYQDKLWENQDSLSPADMEKFAKEIGLDLTKFRADLEDPKVKARVQKDRVDGTTLGLSSTPTLYINGREYTDAKDTESLREWVKEELAK